MASDYSRDQFYRRVHLLTAAGLIRPLRGRQNQIVLRVDDEERLARFGRIERNHPELGLEACLSMLRSAMLEDENVELRDKVARLEAEKATLTKAIVSYRRWTLPRILANIRRLFRRR